MRKDDYLYFHGKTDDVWEAPYLSDLLHGELKIYDVPFDYRIKTAYIYARNAALAVWDGSETANQKKLETKLIETQLLNDIIMAETKGLASRAAVLRKTYIELFMDFHFEDSQGRRYNCDDWENSKRKEDIGNSIGGPNAGKQ